MSDLMNVDASKTIVNYDDEPSKPPPKLEVGLAGWMRQNLFNSPVDIVITILGSLLVLTLVGGFWTGQFALPTGSPS